VREFVTVKGEGIALEGKCKLFLETRGGEFGGEKTKKKKGISQKKEKKEPRGEKRCRNLFTGGEKKPNGS